MTTRPNILLIQADQWHPRALSALGHPNVKTPNLDRLAAQGALFTDATCNEPLCMPSRISMLSGQYPSTTRILGNSGLARRDMPWLPTHLHRQGYATAAFGKFHVASVGAEQWGFDVAAPTMPEDNDLARPADNSYECWCKANGVPWPTDQMHCHIPFGQQACAMFNKEKGRAHWACARSQPSTTSRENSLETWTTDRCIDYLRAHSRAGLQSCPSDGTQPFFVWLSYDRPHSPTTLPPEFYADLHPEDIVLPRLPTEEELAELPPVHIESLRRYCGIEVMGEEAFRFTLATYFRLIEWIDAEIGRVMATLEATGLDAQTAVVFVADHGDDAGEQGIYDKLRQVSSETLTRVPLILRPAPGSGSEGSGTAFPGRVPEGEGHGSEDPCHEGSGTAFPGRVPRPREAPRCVNEPVELVDLFPTFCAWAGVEPPDTIEGRDLSAVAAGAAEADPHRAVFSEMARRRMVKKDGWRLCFDEKDERDNLLFDLNTDPGCYCNRYRDPACRAQRLELKRELTAFLSQRIHGRYAAADVDRIRRGLDPADPTLPPHNCGEHRCIVPYRAALHVRDGKDLLVVLFYEERLLLYKDARQYPLPDDAVADDARTEELLDQGLRRLFEMI